MKIKDEYKGKTIITYDSVLGQRRIEVDKIHPAQFKYYQTIGLGYIFEAESATIAYKAIDEEPKVEPVQPKPKQTRKKRKNAPAN